MKLYFLGVMFLFLLVLSFQLYIIRRGEKLHGYNLSTNEAKEGSANMIVGNIAGVVYFLLGRKILEIDNPVYSYYFGIFNGIFLLIFIVIFLLTYFLYVKKLNANHRSMFILFAYLIVTLVGSASYYYVLTYL